MDHVIAALDADHADAVTRLAVDLADALAIAPDAVACRAPHLTLASYTGLEPDRAAAALGPVAAAAGPFVVRAHGYGVFTGDADTDLSLHVSVVRTRVLDELHAGVCASLGAAGACLSGITHPRVWSPHVTLLDRRLTPRLLGQAVEMLAHRPHRTWSLGITSVTVGVRRGVPAPQPVTLALGTG
jgi:2'-5' RNA ligase